MKSTEGRESPNPRIFDALVFKTSWLKILKTDIVSTTLLGWLIN